jgi:hypothetical protein
MGKMENVRQLARQLVIMQRQLTLLVEFAQAMLEEEEPVRTVRPSVTLTVNGKKHKVGGRR